MNLIAQLEAEQIAALGKNIPDFRPGDTIRVGYKVTEGTRTRVQAYEGVVIARKGGATISASFTVRKISHGEGVERVFQAYSPSVAEVQVKRRGDVRRATRFYWRGRARERRSSAKRHLRFRVRRPLSFLRRRREGQRIDPRRKRRVRSMIVTPL